MTSQRDNITFKKHNLNDKIQKIEMMHVACTRLRETSILQGSRVVDHFALMRQILNVPSCSILGIIDVHAQNTL